MGPREGGTDRMSALLREAAVAGLLVFGLAVALVGVRIQDGAAIAPLLFRFDDVFTAAAAAALGRLGVALLREGDYRRAIAVFELARRISPHVPEVYVNLGYALMGLEAYDKAAGAFQKAIDLRPQQANAYFGLGESLHELRDERGALGAIRTYLHLTPEDDPFRRDALAALWELEDTVAKLPAVELSGVGRQDEAAAHRADEPRSGQMDPDPPPATSASQ